ncbi:MAG: phytanoyl-CoA dioxygenase family protein [Methylacidiphilales bacterium]|nr:phytanoyl-CoA dioxygenase family protein [Candidatus Methylacidiphilales bacterium]
MTPSSVVDVPSANSLEKRSLFFDATPLLDDPAALRNRAEQDGYLFFKHFLPTEPLLELRRQMLEICAQRGWLAPGHDLTEGVIDEAAINQVPPEQMRSDIGVSNEAYHAVQKLELFHTIPHHPKLLSLYRNLFGKEVIPHPRHIARMITCHRTVSPTPPHQDFIHIQGTPKTWTCWFPLGHCPREMGSLTVLRGSNHNGAVSVKPAKGAGDLATILCPHEIDWVEGDFELGDILTFNSCTVHRALRSQHRNRIRLSCDIRFQALDEEIHEASLKPHGEYAWDDLYQGWKNPEVQYYWKNHELRLSAWQEKIHWQKERMCT